jgi:hypothetical protein
VLAVVEHPSRDSARERTEPATRPRAA